MQINNSLNSLVQLEKKLESSTEKLKKLTLGSEHSSTKEHKNLNKQLQKQHQEVEPNISLSEEIVEQQISIPIAYTANAKVISINNDTTKTLLDIKV